MIEFESKFKPNYKDVNDFLPSATFFEKYIQTYFKDDDGREKRVRIHYEIVSLKDNKSLPMHAVLCEKKVVGEEDGIEIREEIEEPINLDAAMSIALNNLASTLIKSRYIVPFHDYKFEVDFYPEFTKIDDDMKDIDGNFVSIEVEFKSKEDRDKFLKLDIPSWVGEEITNDKRYSNRRIAYLEKTNSVVEDTVKKLAGIKNKKNKINI